MEPHQNSIEFCQFHPDSVVQQDALRVLRSGFDAFKRCILDKDIHNADLRSLDVLTFSKTVKYKCCSIEEFNDYVKFLYEQFCQQPHDPLYNIFKAQFDALLNVAKIPDNLSRFNLLDPKLIMELEERLLNHDGTPERSIVTNEIADVVKKYFPPAFTLQLTEAVERDLSSIPLYSKSQMHSACLLYRYGWLPPEGEAQRTITRWCALWNKRDITFNSTWDYLWARLVGNLLLAQFEHDLPEAEQAKKPAGLRGERIIIDLPFIFSRIKKVTKKSSDSLFSLHDEGSFFSSIHRKEALYLGKLISAVILHQPEEAKNFFDTFCIWCLVKAAKPKKAVSLLVIIGKMLAKYSKCLSQEHRKFYFGTLFRHNYVQMILTNACKSPFALSRVYHACPDIVLDVYCNNILPYVYDPSASQLIPRPPEARWITAMDAISSMITVLISHGTPRDWVRLCIPQVLFAALENVGVPSVTMHNASTLFLDRISNVIPFGRVGWIKVKQHLIALGETEITTEDILGPEELWCQTVFQTVIRKYFAVKANTNGSEKDMLDYQFLPFIYRFFSVLALNETIDNDIVESCTKYILSEAMNIDANNIGNCAPILSACVTVFPDTLHSILNQIFEKLLPDECQPHEFNELTEHEITKLLNILSAIVLFSGSMQRVRHQTPPLLPFYSKLLAVIHISIRSPLKKVAAASRPLVFRLLFGLTGVYPTEFCTTVLPERYTKNGQRIVYTEDEFFANFSRTDIHPFGKCACGSIDDLTQLFIQSDGFEYWHHPSKEELGFAQAVAEDIIRFSVTTIENFIDETVGSDATQRECMTLENGDEAIGNSFKESSTLLGAESKAGRRIGLFDFGQETWVVSNNSLAKYSLMNKKQCVIHALSLCRKVVSGLSTVTTIPFRSPNSYLDSFITPLVVGPSNTMERRQSVFEKGVPLSKLSHEFSQAMSLTFVDVSRSLMTLNSFRDDNDFPQIISEAISLFSETLFSGVVVNSIRSQIKRTGIRFLDFAGEFERSHYIVYALSIYEKKLLMRHSPVVNFDPLDCFHVDSKRYTLSSELSRIPQIVSPCQLYSYIRGPSALLVATENALGRLLTNQYDCVAKSAEDGLGVIGLINGVGIKAICTALDYAIADTERPRTQRSFEIVNNACDFLNLAFMTSVQDIEYYYHVIKRLLILAGDGMQVEECLEQVLLTLDFSFVKKYTARQYNFYVKLLNFVVKSPQFCDSMPSVEKTVSPKEPFDLKKDLVDPTEPIVKNCLVEATRAKLLYLLMTGFPMVKESQLVMDSSVVEYLPEKLGNAYVDHLADNLTSTFIDVVSSSIYTLFYPLYFDTVDFSVHNFIKKISVGKVVTNLLELLETHDENDGDQIENATEFDFVVPSIIEFPLFYKAYNHLEIPFMSSVAVMLLDNYMKEEMATLSATSVQFPSSLCIEFHDCGALSGLDFSKAISKRKMTYAIRQIQVLFVHAVHMEFLLQHDARVLNYINLLLDEMMTMVSHCSFSRSSYFDSIVQNVIYEEQCAARSFLKCSKTTDAASSYFKKTLFSRLLNETSERSQIEIASFSVSATTATSPSMAVEDDLAEQNQETYICDTVIDAEDADCKVSDEDDTCALSIEEKDQLQKELELIAMNVEETDDNHCDSSIANSKGCISNDLQNEHSMNVEEEKEGNDLGSVQLGVKGFKHLDSAEQPQGSKITAQLFKGSGRSSSAADSSTQGSAQGFDTHFSGQETSRAELKSKSKMTALRKLGRHGGADDDDEAQDIKDVSIQSVRMMNLMNLLNTYFMTTLDWNDAIALLEAVDLIGLLRHPQTRFVKVVGLLGYSVVFTFEKVQPNAEIDAALSRLNAKLISELTADINFEQEESRLVGLISFIASLSLCWSKLVFNNVYHDLVKLLARCLVGKQKVLDEAKLVFKKICSTFTVQDFGDVKNDFVIDELIAAVKETTDPRVISTLLYYIQKFMFSFLFELTSERLVFIHDVAMQYIVDKSQDVVNEAANIIGLYYRGVLDERARARSADFTRYSKMLCDKSLATRNGAVYGIVSLLYTLELFDESDIKELTKYARRLGHLENDVPEIVCSASTLVVHFWSMYKSSWIQFSKWLSSDIIRTLRGSLAPPSYII